MKAMGKDIPELNHPPVGLGEMKCEICEHWATRHAPIEGKKNTHYCTVRHNECVFPDIHYGRGLP